jgi:hypothetical protein
MKKMRLNEKGPHIHGNTTKGARILDRFGLERRTVEEFDTIKAVHFTLAHEGKHREVRAPHRGKEGDKHCFLFFFFFFLVFFFFFWSLFFETERKYESLVKFLQEKGHDGHCNDGREQDLQCPRGTDDPLGALAPL